MKDIIAKSIQFGLGVYAKAEREAKKMVARLVAEKKLTKQEGEKIVAEVLAQSKKVEKKVEGHVKQSMVVLVKKLRVAAQKDLAALEKKLSSPSKKKIK